MAARKLSFSQTVNPFTGFSFAEIAHSIQSPPTSCQKRSRKCGSYSQPANGCSLDSYIDPVLNGLMKRNDGFLLEDFSSVS